MKTVLIIDDEKDLCALLKKALSTEQYLVDCAYTLADAGSKLKVKNPDIILLDNNMPDGSGLDYYNLYPKRFKKSMVVFITADSSADIGERADLSGVAAFIRKPFSIGVLRDTFKRLA
jgi:DNA-binding response OmpR family regulator